MSPYNMITFSFFLRNFNWRVIPLQHCVGFCCITVWVMYMCVPSLLNLPQCLPHPTPLSCQSTRLSSLNLTAAAH